MTIKALLTALFLPIAMMFSDNDKGIAFEVFQKIPKEDLQKCFRDKVYNCPEDCTRHFADDMESDEDDVSSYSFDINCFANNDGSWTVVLVKEHCFDGCIQETKSYSYKNGVLQEIPDVLPHLSADELLDEGLISFEMGGLGREAMENGYEERELYQIDGDNLAFVIECYAYDGGIMVPSEPKQYVWNGEAFVEVENMASKVQFDHYFAESSLRVDYCLTGNRNETTFSLKELIHEPYWSGSTTNLIDTLEFGNYIVKVFEAGTDNLLFSKGYQNLYGEWQTTPEALTLTKTFDESVIVPFPKVKIDIALLRKTWEGELVEGMRFTVDPDDYFIRSYNNLHLPVYDAWIGNEDITKAVDIVILPEGYTAAEMDKFVKDCDFFVKSLFDYAPYDRYRESFNIRGVMVASEESGCTMPGDNVYKNTAMRFSFWTLDSERYCMSTDNRDIRDFAGQVPYDQIYVLVNTEKYGGGGIYNFYCSSASSNGRSSDVIIHEFGHGFAGLADEYYYAGSSEHMYNLELEPWEPNITSLVDFSNKWGDMMNEETPIPTPREPKYEHTIGVFEGGGYETTGMYSPHMDCLMKTFNGHEFCPVCQRAIERMILYYSK